MLGPRTKDFAFKGAPEPKIQRDSFQNLWNLVCGPPLYVMLGLQRRSQPQDRHLRSKTLPGAPGGSILGPQTKDFAFKGAPEPKIQRDPSQSSWNRECGPPLYVVLGIIC
jgi:hypothetical protein